MDLWTIFQIKIDFYGPIQMKYGPNRTINLKKREFQDVFEKFNLKKYNQEEKLRYYSDKILKNYLIKIVHVENFIGNAYNNIFFWENITIPRFFQSHLLFSQVFYVLKPRFFKK